MQQDALKVGVVLSGASTRTAVCQLLRDVENKIKEGMFLVIRTKEPRRELLVRVSEVQSFNEFYEIGDIWSEARRIGQKIPESMARRYVICQLEILGRLPDLCEVTIPPSPGDDVLLLKRSSRLFSKIRKRGLSINFGTIYGYEDSPVPLSIEALPMHVAIIGVTGSGKSYTMGYLLEKLSSIETKQGKTCMPGFIVDANGDYLDYYFAFYNNEFDTTYQLIYRFVFPKSYAMIHDSRATPIKIDLNLLNPRELAELIMDYYKTATGSELATSLLEDLFRLIKARGYENINYLFKNDEMFESLLEKINELKVLNGNY